ncbi:MAG: AAA family ATPase [Bacteroidales bacterium]
MKMPFVYGHLPVKQEFTDRQEEMTRLINNFQSQVNMVLISPRRWGKSTLVLRAVEKAVKDDKKLRTCIIDMYNIRNEEEFYSVFAKEILKSTTTKANEIIKTAGDFFKRIIPNISFSAGGDAEFKVNFDIERLKTEPDEILDLAENIAKAKNLKFVVCVDEFQNINEFDEPLQFQKKLRSHWQKHQNVSYCLYGSKRHMMSNIFANSSMPFYKFGDLMFLQKISRDDWVKFIKKRFRQTGKSINAKNAGLIAELTECHSYYVQQLAQQTWLRAEEVASEELVRDAHNSIILQLSMLFQNLTDSLSNTQVYFLNAMINGVVHFNSQNVIKDYKLGSSANVTVIKRALVKKEIIDGFEGKFIILDPMYKHWLANFYFNTF